MQTLAQRLQFYRKQKKMTIKEVAKRLNISQSTYRDWEYGRQIKGEPYLALCEVFEVSLSELFGQTPKGAQRIKKEINQIKNSLLFIEKELISLF